MGDNEIPLLEDLNKEKELGKSYNIDKIIDKIFLGGVEGVSEYEYLDIENIKNILSVMNDPPKIPKEKNIRHKIINIDDLFSENIIKHFKECIEFIERSDKIYIYCTCGASIASFIYAIKLLLLLYIFSCEGFLFLDIFIFCFNKSKIN